MLTKTRSKWRKRIYGYLYEMKKGEENKVAERIIQDIQIYTLDLCSKIRDLEKNAHKKT